MAEYSDMFLEELVRTGLIEQAQAAEIVDEHERTGKPTQEVAQEMGLITEAQGLDLISQLMGAERVDLEHMSVPAETLHRPHGSGGGTEPWLHRHARPLRQRQPLRHALRPSQVRAHQLPGGCHRLHFVQRVGTPARSVSVDVDFAHLVGFVFELRPRLGTARRACCSGLKSWGESMPKRARNIRPKSYAHRPIPSGGGTCET